MPDILGLTRRTVESLNAQADAARYQMLATYTTLVNNVVATAMQEAATQRADRRHQRDDRRREEVARYPAISNGQGLCQRRWTCGANAATRRRRGHAAAPDQAGSAISRPACGADRPISQPSAGGKTRSLRPETARRICRSACPPSWSAAARCDAGGSQSSCRQRPDRHRGGQPAAQHHIVRPMPAAPRWCSTSFSPRHRILDRGRQSRRADCSMAARCYHQEQAARAPIRRRRRRNIAAPCWPLSRMSPTRWWRCNRMPRR